jgi:hypothetical protein
MSIIAPVFDARNTQHCNLSLICGEYGITACVFDTRQDKVVALKCILYTGKSADYNDLNKFVGKIIGEEFLLQLAYNTIRCIYPTQCYTLIPKNLIGTQQYKAQLEWHHELDDLDEIHCCEVKDIEADCLFAVPGPLSATLIEKMGNIKYVHQCVPLISTAMKHSINESKLLLVSITSNFVNLTLCMNGQMKFYHTYPVGSPQDLLYFVLHVIKRFDLDMTHTQILTTGEMRESYRRELDSFFDNISQVKFANDYLNGVQEQIPSQFDLHFLLEQCA